jgi:hypothetical protein
LPARVGTPAYDWCSETYAPRTPAWIAPTTGRRPDALARKLPHYGKYSWLVFGGDAADNEGKGEWPLGDSPLRRVFEPGAAVTALADRKALADEPPVGYVHPALGPPLSGMP